MDLHNFFNSEIKPPFTFNFKLNVFNKDTFDNLFIFKQIKYIFISGILQLFSKNNILDLTKLTLDNITTISNYMLSF